MIDTVDDRTFRMYLLMIRIWALARLFDPKRENSSIADEKGEEKNWKKTPHFFTLTHDATTHHSLLLLSLLSYHRHCSAAITTQSKTLSPRFVANVATHSQ
jgi:hypothetical protein